MPMDSMMRFSKHDRHALFGVSWLKAILASLTLVAPLAPLGCALAQGAVKSVHKDWQIRCDTPPGAKTEQCALIQSVTAEDRANVGLTVIAFYFTTYRKSNVGSHTQYQSACAQHGFIHKPYRNFDVGKIEFGIVFVIRFCTLGGE